MRQIYLYTDGACSGNPGPGGLAAIAMDPAVGHVLTHMRGFRRTTNNRMEILAVIEGMDHLFQDLWRDYRETDIKVTVCSDSQLVVNTMTQGWKRKTNQDLWSRLDDALSRLKKVAIVDFQKVKGHAHDEVNNLVDELAVQASKPQNAVNIDDVYERISAMPVKPETAEPSISEIRLCGCNGPKEDRHLKVLLSNGTEITILGTDGGFSQSGGTTPEFRITIDIAWKYVGWLNGRSL